MDMDMNMFMMNGFGMGPLMTMPVPGAYGISGAASLNLHIDRIPMDTLTSDVQRALENQGVQVTHIEDKRGQKTVHCCAFAIVTGILNVPEEGLMLPLPLTPGVRRVPGTQDLEDMDEPRKMRVQVARQAPSPTRPPNPRATLHIRVMTQRRHWAFGVRTLSWAGLVALLEMAAEGSTRQLILVADDTSQKTSQAHPENFICGFFVEFRDQAAAQACVERCNDQRVVIDRVPFRIATEYTRKDSLKLYDQPLKLRETKLKEFEAVKEAAARLAEVASQPGAQVEFPFKDSLFPAAPAADSPPQSSKLVELFRFVEADYVRRQPKWYQQRLCELGWQAPGSINRNDDILEPLLKSIRLEGYLEKLDALGARSFLDLIELDDKLLQQETDMKVLHRRKLLDAINKLRSRIVEPTPALQVARQQLPEAAEPQVPRPRSEPRMDAASAGDELRAAPELVGGMPRAATSCDPPAQPPASDAVDEVEEEPNPAKMHKSLRGRKTVGLGDGKIENFDEYFLDDNILSMRHTQ